MRLPGSSKGGMTGVQLRALQRDKLHFLQSWPNPEDRASLTNAIKRSIIAELCARDTREYGLPEDNRRGEWATSEMRVGQGVAEKSSLIGNPAWMRDGYRTEDWHAEFDRRRLVFFALWPKGEFAAEWIELITDDDGKDADGEWLCQKHSDDSAGRTFAEEINAPPEADHRPKPRPDGGFGPIHDDSQWRKPKWLLPGGFPREWAESPDAPPVATVPETASVPEPKQLTRRQRAKLPTQSTYVAATK